MSVTFKWNTKYFLDEIRKMNEESVEESCEMLVRDIKSSIVDDPLPSMPWKVPKGKSGVLRGSISYQTSSGKYGGVESPANASDGVKRPSAKFNEVVGVVGSNAKHSSYVELGTFKMMPRPYLRPALAKKWNDIKNIFTKNGKKRFR